MSRHWSVRLLALVLVLACVPGVFAQSQATTGVIEGTVADENEGVLPGATVTLRNTATNYEQVVTPARTAGSAPFCSPSDPTGSRSSSRSSPSWCGRASISRSARRST